MPAPGGADRSALSRLCVSAKHKLRAQPLHGQDVFQVPGVLTVPEAQAFIDAAEALGFQWQGSRGPAYGEAFRDNGRMSVNDADLAQQLWQRTGLQTLFAGMTLDGARAVGLNPNIRMYRYAPGQRFGKHVDDSVEVAAGQSTMYTLLIYLSGGAADGGGGAGAASGSGGSSSSKPAASGSSKRPPAGGARGGGKPAAAATGSADLVKQAVQPLLGGETVFYGHRGRVLASCTPAPGLALLHRHGEHCLEHEALEVKAGTKYILRSDVVFERV